MDVTSTSPQTKSFTMDWEILSQKFRTFTKLRKMGTLCDVVLVADGVKFRAHKTILCGPSLYFRTLFASDWHDKGKHEYTFPGISPESMRLIIDYAYAQFVPIAVGNVESLLAAADQLSMLDLVQLCCAFLEDRLCPENCISIYSTANIYHLPKLSQSALRLILENFKKIHTSEEFLELTLQELCDIIEKDELSISREEVLFDSILRWIMREPTSRKAHISVLLPKVRLARMSTDYLIKIVRDNDLVKASEECGPIVSDAVKIASHLDANGLPCIYYENLLARPRLPSAILLAIGGRTKRTTMEIEAYDSRVDCWMNLTDKQLDPLTEYGIAYLNGSVYCIGGCGNAEWNNCSRGLNTVLVLNLITRTWMRVPPMSCRRKWLSVAVLNGSIYAIGGAPLDGCSSKEVEQYNPDIHSWCSVESMKCDRSAAGATTLHGKIYVCGGYCWGSYLATAECYDPLTQRWTTIAPMRHPRAFLGVIAYKDKIYAVGGVQKGTRMQCVEAYDPVTDTWQDVAPMLHPRSHFGIEVMDDLLFVVGGHCVYTKVEYYNEETGTWHCARDMGTARDSFQCCVVPMMEFAAESLDG